MPAGEPHRPIRSFVLREGRLTEGQARAFERLWPRYGIDYTGAPLDLPGIFGDERPVWLEIGFGNGEALATLAARHPERGFLGIEVHRPGVGRLLLRLEAAGLENVRVVRHDAVEVLRSCLAPGALAGAYLFFPDPWHKTRHHKRRIVQPGFVALLARAIRPGGTFHAATDWEDYAQHMMTVLSANPEFGNSSGCGRYATRPDDRPLTHFEQRGQRLGHAVRDLVFTRLPAAPTHEVGSRGQTP